METGSARSRPGHSGEAAAENRQRGRRTDQIDATEPQPAETTARRRSHQHSGDRNLRRERRGELTWTNSPSSKTSSATTTSPATARRSPSRPKLRSEELTAELQSRFDLVCRLLLEEQKV